MEEKEEIQDGDSPQPGHFRIALGGALNAADDIEQTVATFGDEGVDVKREAGLELPEAVQADGKSKGGIGDEELGAKREDEAEEGGESGDAC